MRQYVSAACGLWFLCAAPALAEPMVVVELYTSQGCSSCPPADEFVAVLAANPQIIPLSLHVDYWDYIGWPDKFAQPKFTARQKAYARAIGSRAIYTPQMIIGGNERVEGYAPEETAAHLKRHLEAKSPVTLTVTRKGDQLVIHADADPPLDGPVDVQLIRYTPKETVEITAGENAGHTVTYFNIVTAWDDIADWPGQAPLDIVMPIDGGAPVVVILQKAGPAEIVAAAVAE